MAKKSSTKKTITKSRARASSKKKTKSKSKKKISRSKGTKKKTRSKTRAKKVTRKFRKRSSVTARKKRRTTRRTGLSGQSTAKIHAELKRREAVLVKLEKRRDAILDQLSSIEKDIAQFGLLSTRLVSKKRPGRLRRSASMQVKRASRKKISLSEALQKALKGRTLFVADAVKAAVRAGYKTKSKHLTVMVNQALLMHTDKFKKVARGQYTAK